MERILSIWVLNYTRIGFEGSFYSSAIDIEYRCSKLSIIMMTKCHR